MQETGAIVLVPLHKTRSRALTARRRFARGPKYFPSLDLLRLLLFPRSSPHPSHDVIDQETFEQLLPLAYQWAKTQEEFVLAHGTPLGSQHMADARRAGVRDVERVRVLVVDRIPLPEGGELADAVWRTRIITADTRCVGVGHAIIIRAEAWGDRELLLHNLVHVAQCERSGSLEQWIRDYLLDRHTSPTFTVGSLEDEARRIAREICAAGAAG
jgi:hypothetical protein